MEADLWLAAYDGNLSNELEVLRCGLVEPNCRDDRGRTLLHLASGPDVKALLEAGTDPFLQNDAGQLPIEVCGEEDCGLFLEVPGML